ncbi:phasin family protein [Oceanicella actignis]|uniref:Phasin family protein n=1 Tax=Oceanicella actignis TaxID=1189325 RepID=A0A1M7TN67_9RHOB|nr:phasin family protein [Oceanicella actignis]TYO85191.1 phasin family protein [Oceanicella actignis]SET72197.1 phasin family protein [Oceanicella actignis]SHN72182.1 phasin family protein [Oceanicella actignis]
MTAAEKIAAQPHVAIPSADEARAAAARQAESLARSLETLARYGQGNVDALLAASNVAAKAAGEMNAEALALARETIEESLTAARELTAARSPLDALEKQAEFARRAFESALGHATKMNEIALTAARAAVEPVAERIAAAGELAQTGRR